MKEASELINILTLEMIDLNLFRGQTYNIGAKRVFGGHVLAQALHAATRTVPEDRIVHSLHAYFILPGDVAHPIIYEVDRIRDGGSFTTRRIIAIQRGKAIFNMSASYQSPEQGLDHQINMPDVPSPDSLPSDTELISRYEENWPEPFKRFLRVERPIEFRPVELFDPIRPGKQEPFRHVWMKAKGTMPDEWVTHQQVLAYASDYNLLTTAILPHGDITGWDNLFLASLDHAMYFHRAFRIDQWLLYAIDSPSASNARGFTTGKIFDQEGRLVASVVQEGLMRSYVKP